MTPPTPAILGTTAPGWEHVRDVFAANWEAGEEVGAAFSAYHRGRKVVDLWGGWFDEARTAPYTEGTLQLVFSTTKGITAIAVAMCVDRGLLDYDATVASVWPEFAAAGKEHVTVSQLLSHRAGLYTVDGTPTLADALDWDVISAMLAAQAPLWRVGSTHGYHAVTFGWLAGELVRRVDPARRSLGRFVAEEIAAPLGAEFWIGLPADQFARVSPVIGTGRLTDDPGMDPAVKAMIEQMMGPDTPGGRALSLSGAMADGAFNRHDVWAAEVPAANGIGTARSLARIYAATLGEVDGMRLLGEAVRDRARTRATPEGEADACLLVPTTFGMGFMTHGPFTVMLGPGSYGHPGAGGSIACARPEAGLACAYVMNRMATNLAGDVRAQRLLDAASAAAG
jgi:CubicO group peptidase (beta-lactamase class C family)